MNKRVKDICKLGQGRKCCRYLTVNRNGFSCEKLGSLRDHLDHATHMVARGDNCNGLVEVEWRKLNDQQTPAA